MDTTQARAVVVLAVVVVAAGLFAAAPRAGRLPTEPCCADPAQAWLAGQKLDLNAASAKDLERIRGIGPALANKIVQAREEGGGRFSSVDELDRVPGIGPKLLARLKDEVSVTAR